MDRDFEIRREIELAATPEQVWEAITTRHGFAGWFADVEPIPDVASREAWEPPRCLLVRLPRASNGATQAFEYVIESRGEGQALLRFVHSGFLGNDWEGGFDFASVTGEGWDMYLHTLAEYLEYFRGRPATYVEAEDPAASASTKAWPALLAALGLSIGVMPGDRVRLAPKGLPPIAGVVDYVSEHFLGLRADDALYRFHGRAPLGLPIAVGHHFFDGGVDAAAIAEAWRIWLAAVFS